MNSDSDKNNGYLHKRNQDEWDRMLLLWFEISKNEIVEDCFGKNRLAMTSKVDVIASERHL
jgi:hypothetical protein